MPLGPMKSQELDLVVSAQVKEHDGARGVVLSHSLLSSVFWGFLEVQLGAEHGKRNVKRPLKMHKIPWSSAVHVYRNCHLSHQ